MCFTCKNTRNLYVIRVFFSGLLSNNIRNFDPDYSEMQVIDYTNHFDKKYAQNLVYVSALGEPVIEEGKIKTAENPRICSFMD